MREPFLWSEIKRTGEIYGRMTIQNVDNCMGQRKVKKGTVRGVVNEFWTTIDCNVSEIKQHIYQRIRDNKNQN
jgi:hypothetical protein